jgi:Protein of unknown function (DUF2889)
MPLSEPAPREPSHRRRVECHGYRRADGLWDIEGHLVDTKPVETEHAWRGRLPAGEPVHDMWVRLTIDADMMVRDAEAAVERSPYPPCPRAAPSLAALKGHRIAPGWSILIKRLLGGVTGCTHLTELLLPLATTAYQTLGAERRTAPPAPGVRPAKIDSCYAYSHQREVVARFWPEFYEGP